MTQSFEGVISCSQKSPHDLDELLMTFNLSLGRLNVIRLLVKWALEDKFYGIEDSLEYSAI